MGKKEIRVPDIGDFKDVPVIEVHVKAGGTIAPEDALITLESDKASFDVPAPEAGKIVDVLVKVGDKVSEGSVMLTLEVSGDDERERETPRPVTDAPATAARPVAEFSGDAQHV
ncbi:MAG: biotin/lipoyl-containing protein, partial [Hyphomicrobium sp.]